MSILTTINLFLQVAILWMQNDLEKAPQKTQDEMDRIAANGSPADKLRLEALSLRLEAEQQRLVRSRNIAPH